MLEETYTKQDSAHLFLKNRFTLFAYKIFQHDQVLL